MDATRDALRLAHGDITGEIIGAFHDVYNDLEHGCFESVYVRSLVVALGDRGISCEREAPLIVRFRGTIVGEFRVDLLVERSIIVEVKIGERIVPLHERQLLNYLRASWLSVGLILNVGERPSVRRMIWTDRPGKPPAPECADTPQKQSTETHGNRGNIKETTITMKFVSLLFPCCFPCSMREIVKDALRAR